MRRVVLTLGLGVLACGSPPVAGVLRADVSFVRYEAGAPDCIVVRATDPTSGGNRTGEARVTLEQKSAVGTVMVAIARGARWSNEVDVVAELHLGACDAPVVDSDAVAGALVDGKVASVSLTVIAPLRDGGVDAGPLDGGSDGGADAGSDGGFDGGADAGVDAGIDAGVDAGADAGASASCDGGLRLLAGPLATYHDVRMLDAGVAVIVGLEGAVTVARSTGLTPVTVGPCGGDLYATWVRPSDKAVFAVAAAGNDGGLFRVDLAGSCTRIGPLPTAAPRVLFGIEDAGTTRLFAAGFAPGNNKPWVYRVDVGGGTNAQELEQNGDVVYDVDGVSEGVLFAVGETSSGQKGFIDRYQAGTWNNDLTLGGNTGLYALAVVSPTLAYAGGQGFHRWNGSTWSTLTSLPYNIYGLAALGANDVYAVGPNGMAHWDGSTWTALPLPVPIANLNRVRGSNACDLWAAGTDGGVVTTHP